MQVNMSNISATHLTQRQCPYCSNQLDQSGWYCNDNERRVVGDTTPSVVTANDRKLDNEDDVQDDYIRTHESSTMLKDMTSTLIIKNMTAKMKLLRKHVLIRRSKINKRAALTPVDYDVNQDETLIKKLENKIDRISVDLMYEQSKSYELQKQLEQIFSNSSSRTTRNKIMKVIQKHGNSNDNHSDDDAEILSSASSTSSLQSNSTFGSYPSNSEQNKNPNLLVSNRATANQNENVESSQQKRKRRKLLNDPFNIQNEHLVTLIRERDVRIREQESLVESLEQQLVLAQSYCQSIIQNNGIVPTDMGLPPPKTFHDVAVDSHFSNHLEEFGMNLAFGRSQKPVRDDDSSMLSKMKPYERYKMRLGTPRISTDTEINEMRLETLRISKDVEIGATTINDQESILSAIESIKQNNIQLQKENEELKDKNKNLEIQSQKYEEQSQKYEEQSRDTITLLESQLQSIQWFMKEMLHLATKSSMKLNNMNDKKSSRNDDMTDLFTTPDQSGLLRTKLFDALRDDVGDDIFDQLAVRLSVQSKADGSKENYFSTKQQEQQLDDSDHSLLKHCMSDLTTCNSTMVDHHQSFVASMRELTDRYESMLASSTPDFSEWDGSNDGNDADCRIMKNIEEDESSFVVSIKQYVSINNSDVDSPNTTTNTKRTSEHTLGCSTNQPTGETDAINSIIDSTATVHTTQDESFDHHHPPILVDGELVCNTSAIADVPIHPDSLENAPNQATLTTLVEQSRSPPNTVLSENETLTTPIKESIDDDKVAFISDDSETSSESTKDGFDDDDESVSNHLSYFCRREPYTIISNVHDLSYSHTTESLDTPSLNGQQRNDMSINTISTVDPLTPVRSTGSSKLKGSYGFAHKTPVSEASINQSAYNKAMMITDDTETDESSNFLLDLDGYNSNHSSTSNVFGNVIPESNDVDDNQEATQCDVRLPLLGQKLNDMPIALDTASFTKDGELRRQNGKVLASSQETDLSNHETLKSIANCIDEEKAITGTDELMTNIDSTKDVGLLLDNSTHMLTSKESEVDPCRFIAQNVASQTSDDIVRFNNTTALTADSTTETSTKTVDRDNETIPPSTANEFGTVASHDQVSNYFNDIHFPSSQNSDALPESKHALPVNQNIYGNNVMDISVDSSTSNADGGAACRSTITVDTGLNSSEVDCNPAAVTLVELKNSNVTAPVENDAMPSIHKDMCENKAVKNGESSSYIESKKDVEVRLDHYEHVNSLSTTHDSGECATDAVPVSDNNSYNKLEKSAPSELLSIDGQLLNDLNEHDHISPDVTQLLSITDRDMGIQVDKHFVATLLTTIQQLQSKLTKLERERCELVPEPEMVQDKIEGASCGQTSFEGNVRLVEESPTIIESIPTYNAKLFFRSGTGMEKTCSLNSLFERSDCYTDFSTRDREIVVRLVLLFRIESKLIHEDTDGLKLYDEYSVKKRVLETESREKETKSLRSENSKVSDIQGSRWTMTSENRMKELCTEEIDENETKAGRNHRIPSSFQSYDVLTEGVQSTIAKQENQCVEQELMLLNPLPVSEVDSMGLPSTRNEYTKHTEEPEKILREANNASMVQKGDAEKLALDLEAEFVESSAKIQSLDLANEVHLKESHETIVLIDEPETILRDASNASMVQKGDAEKLTLDLEAEFGESSSKIQSFELANEVHLKESHETRVSIDALVRELETLRATIQTVSDENEDLKYQTYLSEEVAKSHEKQLKALSSEVDELLKERHILFTAMSLLGIPCSNDEEERSAREVADKLAAGYRIEANHLQLFLDVLKSRCIVDSTNEDNEIAPESYSKEIDTNRSADKIILDDSALDRLDNENVSLHLRIDLQASDIKSLEERNREQESELTELRAQNLLLNQCHSREVEALHASLKIVTEEKADMETKFAQQVSELAIRIESLRAALAMLLKSSNELTNSSLKSIAAEKSGLLMRLERQTTQINSLEEKSRKEECEVALLREQNLLLVKSEVQMHYEIETITAARSLEMQQKAEDDLKQLVDKDNHENPLDQICLLETTLAEGKEEHTSLKNAYDVLVSEIEELVLSLQYFSREMETHHSTVKAIRDEKDCLESQVASSNEQVKQLEVQIECLLANQHENDLAMDLLKSGSEQINGSLERFESEKSALDIKLLQETAKQRESELSDLRAQNLSLMNRERQVLCEIETIKAAAARHLEMETLEKEDLILSNQHYAKEIDVLLASVSSLTEEKDCLVIMLAEAKDREDEIKTNLESFEQINGSNKDLLLKLGARDSDIKSLTAKSKQQECEIANLRTQIEALKKEAEVASRLQIEIQLKAAKDLNEAENKIMDAEREVTFQMKKIDDLMTAATTNEDNLTALQEAYNRIVLEHEELILSNQSYSREVNLIHASFKAIMDEKEKLESIVATSNKQVKQLEAQVESLLAAQNQKDRDSDLVKPKYDEINALLEQFGSEKNDLPLLLDTQASITKSLEVTTMLKATAKDKNGGEYEFNNLPLSTNENPDQAVAALREAAQTSQDKQLLSLSNRGAFGNCISEQSVVDDKIVDIVDRMETLLNDGFPSTGNKEGSETEKARSKQQVVKEQRDIEHESNSPVFVPIRHATQIAATALSVWKPVANFMTDSLSLIQHKKEQSTFISGEVTPNLDENSLTETTECNDNETIEKSNNDIEQQEAQKVLQSLDFLFGSFSNNVDSVSPLCDACMDMIADIDFKSDSNVICFVCGNIQAPQADNAIDATGHEQENITDSDSVETAINNRFSEEQDIQNVTSAERERRNEFLLESLDTMFGFF